MATSDLHTPRARTTNGDTVTTPDWSRYLLCDHCSAAPGRPCRDLRTRGINVKSIQGPHPERAEVVDTAFTGGLGIADAPWLPCSWCNFMRPDCTCKAYPVSEKAWEQALDMSAAESRRLRETARRVAEWQTIRSRWAA